MRILKYILEITDKQTIKLPVGFRVLTVQMQAGKLCMWAMVDSVEETTITHTVFVIGTGHPCGHVASYNYLGTVQDRILVWHVFIN